MWPHLGRDFDTLKGYFSFYLNISDMYEQFIIRLDDIVLCNIIV